MRLVADENCDFSLVTDLRAAGYDVVAITEQMAGADDQRVIDLKAILEKYSGRSFQNEFVRREHLRCVASHFYEAKKIM